MEIALQDRIARRHGARLVAIGASLLILSGCATTPSSSKTDETVAGPTTLVVRRIATVSRINGEVVVKLRRPTGDKQKDEAEVAKVLQVYGGFPDLEEGGTLDVYGDGVPGAQ